MYHHLDGSPEPQQHQSSLSKEGSTPLHAGRLTPVRRSRTLKFDSHGKLTKHGQRFYALRVIRDYMREYARTRRRWNDPVMNRGLHTETCAAIRLARACELITEVQAGDLVLRLMRIERAPITRGQAKTGAA